MYKFPGHNKYFPSFLQANDHAPGMRQRCIIVRKVPLKQRLLITTLITTPIETDIYIL